VLVERGHGLKKIQNRTNPPGLPNALARSSSGGENASGWDDGESSDGTCWFLWSLRRRWLGEWLVLRM
jgi:hypothetical protein